MVNPDLRVRVLLSLQRALLGEVTPNLRGVTCSWDQSLIRISALFDGKVSEENRESMECVATEVMSDFPDFQVILECQRLDVPEPLSSHALMAWAYSRREGG